MSDEEHGSAVAEPIVTTQTEPKAKARPSTETRRQPPYNVIVLNDEEQYSIWWIDRELVTIWQR